jgi:hypothetical protein
MITTAFIVGLFLGLFLGWLRLRQMAKALTTLTNTSKELDEEAGLCVGELVLENKALHEALGKERASVMGLEVSLTKARLAFVKDQIPTILKDVKGFVN